MEIKDIGDAIQIRLSPFEKIFSVHGNFKIPKENIAEFKEHRPKTSWKELRIPGTFLPTVIKAGSYYTPRGWEFWYWTRSKKHTYTLELRNMRYKRMVISTSDPVHLSL